ncbi:hypothetical protein GCM10023314_11730 [Algibacter agarivorans]|uniref:Uncharacterized protein n=1 Tax=Algibacter agarivorans TaxID=1109741 RepID=A0ABP9GI06_9FLAO
MDIENAPQVFENMNEEQLPVAKHKLHHWAHLWLHPCKVHLKCKDFRYCIEINNYGLYVANIEYKIRNILINNC